jgi:hypothetical protein
MELWKDMAEAAIKNKNGRFKGVLINSLSLLIIFLIKKLPVNRPIKTFIGAFDMAIEKGVKIIDQWTTKSNIFVSLFIPI